MATTGFWLSRVGVVGSPLYAAWVAVAVVSAPDSLFSSTPVPEGTR